MKTTGIIYKATRISNGRSYIGQSKQNLIDRKSDHEYDACVRFRDTFFHRALRKDNRWQWSVLEECSVDKLDEREKHWIAIFDSYNQGYNMTEGGDSNPMDYDGVRERVSSKTKGVPKTEEHKQKISHSHMGVPKPHNQGENNGSYKFFEKHGYGWGKGQDNGMYLRSKRRREGIEQLELFDQQKDE